MDSYEAIDAARNFIRAIRRASDSDLAETFQRIASDCNSSEYANSHEPLAGIVDAILAEQKRRTYNEERNLGRR